MKTLARPFILALSSALLFSCEDQSQPSTMNEEASETAETKQFSIPEIRPSEVALMSPLLGGTGQRTVALVENRRRDHQGSTTISQNPDGSYLLSTDQDSLQIWSEQNQSGGVGGVIVPSGVGATFRFVGTVSDFYPGYTFIAEGTEPLVFTLDETTGLSFVSGTGSVLLLNGESVKLTGPANP